METIKVITCPVVMGYQIGNIPVNTNPMVSPEEAALVERIVKFHDTQAGEIIYDRYAKKVLEMMNVIFGKDLGGDVAHRFWAHLWINKIKTTDVANEARKFAQSFQRKESIKKKNLLPLSYIYQKHIKVIDPSYNDSEETLED